MRNGQNSVAIETRATRAPVRFETILSRPAVFGSLIPIVTLLNAIVGMLLPKLMEPRAFGEYSLVVTLFNYGLIFDLGVSQVIDRRIPAFLGAGHDSLAGSIGDKLLWVRLAIGVIAFGITGVVLLTLDLGGKLPFSLIAGVLAGLAGLADMVAQGPVCVYRARSQRRDYAVRIAILLSGLIFARLGGLMFGGLIGCFAALSIWYIVCGIFFHRRMPLVAAERPTAREAIALTTYGIPFFATAFIWAFYVTGNRWIASFLIPLDQFGEFAFSANIFSLLVGAAGGFSAFYYRKIVEKISRAGDFAVSGKLTSDLIGLTLATSVVVAIGIALAGVLIRFIYPDYAGGIPTSRVILVAVPPLTLASWLMPLSLSAGKRPLVDGLVIYPLATAILGLAIASLYRRFGDEGAAWASTVSAIPLVAMQLLVLRHAGIMRMRHVCVLFGVCLACCLILGSIAWSFSL